MIKSLDFVHAFIIQRKETRLKEVDGFQNGILFLRFTVRNRIREFYQ